ncbi:MAG: hypothetical protein ACR2OF_01785 [Hyphomicrobium sp.]
MGESMFGTLFRVLFGFIVACLVAGVALVAFVITPADIATLPAESRWERLGSAGMLSLLAATHAAIFAFPFALVAIAIAEWLSIRSWIYYVLVGIAIALAGFGAHHLAEVGSEPTIVNDYAIRAFLTLGFFGGFAYWMAAGRRAGGRRVDNAKDEGLRTGAEISSEV